ncbi:integrating conjugative element protein (TIGR03757 family) [Bisgaardia hudsonensis]|uniref:Integrating conjugative element protein (TIGR03757 family) n=1 Tax=Bisgaardia hudsonensis TaxID=109472 RepID=A0A4R2N3D7_9PAST|nr:TIGR03757 family integrating conjugative element protein [Bisgaardia hudsonensis]QLB12794.1 integrating conjugative element protein [Bisgaardia hudsonensis]TCP14349.1 integrating conjugative element protein (TIGR03757 family) [Bisgaardia hudsonensis]
MKKKSYFYSYLAFLIGSTTQLSFANTEPNISVYTTLAYRIENPELATQIYYLDKVEQIENWLSQRFSRDPRIAEQQAKALLNSPQWAEKEKALKESYTGVISGWQNGIKKVPAVLFQSSNGDNAIIYGETNISKAKQLWQQWNQHRGKIQ